AVRYGGSSPSMGTYNNYRQTYYRKHPEGSETFRDFPAITLIKFKTEKDNIMATVTRENLSLLNDKLTVKINKEDYYPSFEKAIKEYSKKANIPGFRKGMVPAGMVKKMYGNSLFTNEVCGSLDRKLEKYLKTEKI